MSQAEIEARETYEERTGMPPPPVFDTLQMTFHIVDQEDQTHQEKLEVDLQRFNYLKVNAADPFSFIPIDEAGKIVVSELVTIENAKTGKFELFYKAELDSYKQIWAYDTAM